MNDHVRHLHLHRMPYEDLLQWQPHDWPEPSPAAQRRRADHAFRIETYQLMGMLGRVGVEKELRQRERFANNRDTAPDARRRQLHLIEIVRQVLDEEGDQA